MRQPFRVLSRMNQSTFVRSSISVISVLAVVAGCASNPTIPSMSSAERQRASEITILNAASIPMAYRMLGSVDGSSCKSLSSSDATSREEALLAARLQAAKLGADAITNLMCEQRHDSDWVRGCLQKVVCSGDAISRR